jgi:hypothetical protein
MTGGTTSAALAVIRSAGIPVMANNEWLEPTALARAEWLKYMALFLNEERAARQLYSEMKGRYQRLSGRAMAIPDDRKPTIMTGRGTRGDSVIAGGRSYMAALIEDAGGRYVWTDDAAEGSATIDLEAQIRRAGNADIWINGGGWPSLASMVKDEPRYAEFKAYRAGQVWVYERKVTPTGGNDYWSRSVSHPDLLLADLVKIFHPTLARARVDGIQVPRADPAAMTIQAHFTRVDGSSRRAARDGRREALVFCGLAAGLVIAFVLSLAFGSTHVPIGRVVEVILGISTERDGAAIVVEAIRLPRSLTALLSGAALGIAGLQMQTLFRNPLADPFALGISSGASLGVAIVVLGSGMSAAAAFGVSTGLRGDALLIGAAIAGALAVLALVLVVSSRVPIRQPSSSLV